MFSKTQHSILIGSLLGDGFLSRPKPTHNSIFGIRRASKDYSYLEWEFSFFKTFCTNTYPVNTNYFDKRTNKIYYTSLFKTKSLEIFNPFFTHWYPNKTKIIPRNLRLDSLILTIWFLDDGSVSKTKYNRPAIKLSTNGFQKDDVCFLASLLSKRFKYSFNVHRNGSHYVIQSSGNGAIKFIEEIDKLIPPCMNRKAVWRSGFNMQILPIRKPVLSLTKLYQYLTNKKLYLTTSDIASFFESKNIRRHTLLTSAEKHFKKLLKCGYLCKIDLGFKKEKIYCITDAGARFFKQFG